MKAIIILFWLLCPVLLAGTPTEAVAAFEKAAKAQQFDATWKLTAQYEGASAEVTKYLKSRIERILKAKAEGYEMEALEEKISGDCAVVITNESNKAAGKLGDVDPVFLIKQGGEWRVLPNVTHWDTGKRIPPDKQPASMKLDAGKIAAFEELEKWVKERKAALRKDAKP